MLPLLSSLLFSLPHYSASLSKVFLFLSASKPISLSSSLHSRPAKKCNPGSFPDEKNLGQGMGAVRKAEFVAAEGSTFFLFLGDGKFGRVEQVLRPIKK